MAGTVSGRDAVELYLDRLDQVEPLVNSVCTPNPDLTALADRADGPADASEAAGPLRGRLVLVKDNIDTADLPTTAGSLALADVPPPTRDAPIVARLRQAGMLLAGKANLSEWANIRDPASTSGWSAYGGLTRNPYGLNRSAGGSSSGSGAAVAAGLVDYAIGTETDGSITCPAAFNGCVGIKPTVGLLPAGGVVPISVSQDTAGPITRTVTQAAELLTVLASDGTDYAAHARPEGLVGKRIGVPRQLFWGYSAAADSVGETAVAWLSAAGAEIVDPTDLTAMVDYGSDDELLVLLSELTAGLADYLPTRGPLAPQSLADVVAFNRAHADDELRWFGQRLLEQALEAPTPDSAEFHRARSRCLDHSRKAIDELLAEHRLDALVTPSYTPAGPIDLVNAEADFGGCTQPTAMAGYPIVTVPVTLVHGLPVAVSFWGTARSEPTLIEIARGFEARRDVEVGPLPTPTFPAFV